ncbi:MAG: ATPase [Candidatus Pacebacteria bacterium]|nr:ATPase [Candidatus Paceibacterota bacterium]
MTSHTHHSDEHTNSEHKGHEDIARSPLSTAQVSAFEDGEFYITKEDGEIEKFESKKLEESLVRSGAVQTTADKIVRTVMEDLRGGVCDPGSNPGAVCTVHQIYHKAFEILKETSRAAAARYSLRRSIMEFGPTGFPFEEYVAGIFKAKGYETLTGQMVLGGCVPHEVDVIAWNADKLIMAEVKYHNEHAGKSDLKTALYIKARYDDLKDNLYQYGNFPARKIDDWYLITNTKFTETAITYAGCKGLKLISWGYPERGNLLDMIEETKLHPVTCLTTLTDGEKRELLGQDIVLCKTIYEKRQLLKDLGYSDAKIFKVMEEIGQIINLEVRE